MGEKKERREGKQRGDEEGQEEEGEVRKREVTEGGQIEKRGS